MLEVEVVRATVLKKLSDFVLVHAGNCAIGSQWDNGC